MKNNYNFLIGILILFTSCQKEKATFEKIDCIKHPEIENNNLRQIFKPCRTLTYRARYWNVGYEPISDELIQVDVPGRVWEYQPESQDEIVFQYRYDPEKTEKLIAYSLNPELAYWTQESTTGVIETANRVWMHPFRSNQYTFTEVAPFPEVRLPLTLGKTWGGALNIGDGWGAWAHSTVNHVYEVVAQEEVELPLGQLQTWQISSTGAAPYGTSKHNFWFNEQFGFVKMTVKNYRGQLLQFKLIDVQDH